jgi:hypothetical protein
VETWQRPDLGADFAPRLERTMAPSRVAAMATTRVGRDRAVRPEVPGDGDDGETGTPEVVALPDSGASLIRSGAPQVAARQALAGSGDRLLAEARDACRREGVAATRRELLMRVAKRVGLPQAEVARGLSGALRREGAAAVFGGFATRRPRDSVWRLAAAILGTREREVFLARRVARPDDVAALHALAAGLGLSVERVYELEASARRKLARALG